MGTRPERFADRRDAGRQLALQLKEATLEDAVVLALPRGGVPVAEEIASSLGSPLEVFGVRKLGAPGNPEYGIGAIAEGGVRLVDPEATAVLGVRNGELEAIVETERAELDRRVRLYRGGRRLPDLRGRTTIVVDDGAATGLTDLAAIRAIRRLGARWIVLAVPVASPEALELLRRGADQIACLRVPRSLGGVSRWYRDFGQVSDEEVVDALRRPARAAA